MLVRIRQGDFDPEALSTNGDIEPKGRELWSGEVGDLTVTALHDAKIDVQPGEWYPFPTFKSRIESADVQEEGVYSTVTTSHLGVGKPWTSTIEVSELNAALMVCRAVIEHIEDSGELTDVWVRIE